MLTNIPNLPFPFRNSSVLLCMTNPIVLQILKVVDPTYNIRWWSQHTILNIHVYGFLKYNHLPHSVWSSDECTCSVCTSPLTYTRFTLHDVIQHILIGFGCIHNAWWPWHITLFNISAAAVSANT